jgi:hypothetical protein
MLAWLMQVDFMHNIYKQKTFYLQMHEIKY